MNLAIDALSSFAASSMRLGAGMMCRIPARRPERLLELYEFEACPYCRLVREALTELDLDVLVYPCPKGGVRFRPRALELGGKQQFPYLVDPGPGARMYESADIIRYLYAEYGDGRRPPAHLTVRPYAVVGSMLTSVVRGGRGVRARASRPPEQPLELWSFEASPFARLVRETLCELELPHVLHTLGRRDLREAVPRGLRGPLGVHPEPSTDKRRELFQRAGKVQVPYLADPNTGTDLFESAAICRYLEATYAV